jgi:hypothetical protein
MDSMMAVFVLFHQLRIAVQVMRVRVVSILEEA